jgi:hypothetical protein
MNKKLQVFVSSTYTDLIEERQAAVEAILDAGHIPAGMELFKAGKSQMKTIQKWIDESDVYMLILGGRYGSIEEESGLSYTELEYRYALSKNMPVFAIVLDDSFLLTKAASKGKNAIFEKENTDKYDIFKESVKDNIVKFVKNNDQISKTIVSHLNVIKEDSDYHLVGWIRGNNFEYRSIDFKSLKALYDNFIIVEGDGTNANQYYINWIPVYNRGISSKYYKGNFEATTIFVLYGLLGQKENNNNDEQILVLTKLGADYYQYLLSNL